VKIDIDEKLRQKMEKIRKKMENDRVCKGENLEQTTNEREGVTIKYSRSDL